MTVTYIYKNKVSPLFVDKVSFTLDLTETELAGASCKLDQLLKSHYGMRTFAPNYKKSANLLLDDLGDSKLLVQVDSKVSVNRNFRCVFNPASEKLDEVRTFLDYLVPGGGYMRVVKAGICTRIDLTVDVKGSHLSRLYVHMHQVSKSEARYGAKLLETLYLGSAKSEKRFCAYDKNAQIKDKNKKSARKQALPASEVVRFEVRLKKKMLLSGLKSIDNPFTPIKVAECPTESEDDWVFGLFLAACEGTTTQNALKILPKKVKKEYVARLDKAEAKWWQPDKIWSQFPSLVDALLNPPKAAFSLHLLDQVDPVA